MDEHYKLFFVIIGRGFKLLSERESQNEAMMMSMTGNTFSHLSY